MVALSLSKPISHSAGYTLISNPIEAMREFTAIEKMTLEMSFSYFLVDTVFGIIQRYNDFWMNLHHGIIFIVYAVALRDNNVASELMLTVFFGELTNPFNLLRQIFSEQEKPAKARLQGIFFIASFFLLRIILGPIFVWWICSNPNVNIIIKLGACLMRTF